MNKYERHSEYVDIINIINLVEYVLYLGLEGVLNSWKDNIILKLNKVHVIKMGKINIKLYIYFLMQKG